jgi:hypothetical protein
MSSIESTIWCDNCGVEILWAPWIDGKRTYCCQDCKELGFCACGEHMEIDDDRRGLRTQSIAVMEEFGP